MKCKLHILEISCTLDGDYSQLTNLLEDGYRIVRADTMRDGDSIVYILEKQ